jgi:hypothetical protein
MTLTRRGILVVVVLAAAHVMLTMWTAVAALGASMEGFDAAGSSASERFVGVLSDVLLFPLVKPGLGINAPGLWGYLILLANGLLWAVLLVTVWNSVTTIYRRRAAPPPVRGT